MLEVENLHRKLSKPALHSPLKCHLASRNQFHASSFEPSEMPWPNQLWPLLLGHQPTISLQELGLDCQKGKKKHPKQSRVTSVWVPHMKQTHWKSRLPDSNCLKDTTVQHLLVCIPDMPEAPSFLEGKTQNGINKENDSAKILGVKAVRSLARGRQNTGLNQPDWVSNLYLHVCMSVLYVDDSCVAV